MAKIFPSEDNTIFALDIGTRTVIGIVALVESGKLRVAAQYILEHESRSMFDGQIHDIPKVADTVLEVKRVLEKKVGFKLTRAAIAAAGRALVTKHCKAEMEVDSGAEIDGTMVNGLEIACIRNAHRELDLEADEKSEKYYCVGYSVVRYYLDNYPVTNLVGHQGSSVCAEIVATFLPESVVSGLYSVLRRVDLEPVNLTLEPIAAIEVVIPDSMRFLNLALVDIGAGTSDIAICRKGSVVSYGMVPVAGDEVTEAISDALLVDFNEAEKIKRVLEKGGDISYKDVLGVECTTAAADVGAVIEPVLDRLASEVAAAITGLNGGDPPRAVFCVGGGSRLHGLTGKLAKRLGIDSQRVAVRGRDAISNLVVDEEGLEGPEGVTVVGIGAVAVKKLGQNFVTIMLDGKEFKLFNSKDLSVSNALSLVEFNPRDLIGHNGRDVKVILNGSPEVVYGGLARPAEIYINGLKANMKSSIKEGDEIKVLKAVPGEDARVSACDFMDGPDSISITLNGEPMVIRQVCMLNRTAVPYDTGIKSGDQLEIRMEKTVADLFEGVDLDDCTVQANSGEVSLDWELKDGDDIKLIKKKAPAAKNDVAVSDEKAPCGGETISVTVNGGRVSLNGSSDYIFIDVFNRIDFDLSERKGTLVLKLNGSIACYTDVLSDGDSIEIYWDQPGE